MRKILWMTALVMFAASLQVLASEIVKNATTSDGQKVFLFSDGTWKFAQQETVRENSGGFQKSDKATSVAKSKKGYVEFWYNPEKWQILDTKISDDAEFSFGHKSDECYAIAIVERISMPLETLKNVALQNARSAAPDARIVSEEDRIVNGKKILAMSIEGTIEGIKFKYLGYYWTGEAGALQVLTFTGQNLFDEYEADLAEFLSGVEITKE